MSRLYTELLPSPRCWVETVALPAGGFETMALLSPLANDTIVCRCRDWEEAQEAHEAAVRWALGLLLHTDPERPAS